MSVAAKYQGWLISAVYNGLQKISIPLFGVISAVMLARFALTKSENGVWQLFLTITAVVEMLRQGLVKTSLIKFINYSEGDDHKYVLSAALFLNIVITVLIGAGLFLIAPYLAAWQNMPQLKSMLYIFQVGIFLLIPFSHFEWLMYGKIMFKQLFWVYLIRQGLPLILMIIVYLINKKVSLDTLVILYCSGIAISTMIAYVYVRAILTKTFVLSKQWLTKMWHFGKYVFGTNVSTLVMLNAQQIMLSPILGDPKFTASQGNASRIVNLADIPSQVLADILFPKSSSKEHSDNPETIKYFYEKTVGASLCFILPTVLFILLFPKFLIYVLFGEQYYDAIPYLQLISITGIFMAFMKHFGVIIDSTGKPHINFITTTIIGGIFLFFSNYGIKQWGFIGSAYAAIASYIVGVTITQIILYRFYKISFINCFKYAFRFYPEIFKLVMEKTGRRKLKTTEL